MPVTRKSNPTAASADKPRQRSVAAKPGVADTPVKPTRKVATRTTAAASKTAKPATGGVEAVPAVRKPARAGKSAEPAPATTPKPARTAKVAKPAAAAKPTGAASKPGKAAKVAPSKPASPRVAAGAQAKKPASARARKPAEKPIEERVRDAVVARLDSMKAQDLKLIDVRGKTSVTDCIVIATGTSTRHVKSMADEVVVTAKKHGMMPLGVEGEKEAEWVLVDLGDTVIHVMLPRTREFYALERLWTMAEESRANPA